MTEETLNNLGDDPNNTINAQIDENEALLRRAIEEREKLFKRYELGREQGAVIDPWEDPGFEVYHQTDRYGFIHDKRLPRKIDPNEAKARAIEMERVKKWLKMTSKWDDKKTREVLHKRICKGIPDKLRSKVWLKLLNIEKTMKENKNVYQKMLSLAREWATEARQIDSDVNRQFRDHLFYRERYSIKQRSLFNVLTAYSMYNMEVGYCQGMSGVAGVLLMYMDEEEAFWALSILFSDKKYAMHGFYIDGFPKLQRFLAHHDKILTKFIPKLKKRLDEFNLDSILYSLKWFFVIFIERIPFSLCLRVWDIYLLVGERVVTAMAYTILRLHKNKLIEMKEMDTILQYLQVSLCRDFGYSDDYAVEKLLQSMDDLRKAKLELPPPGGENEFPRRPFGVFVEPNFEAKVGIRKTIFSDTEKQVTDTIIKRRELTAQELAESRLKHDGLLEGESNGQLNAGHVPESEDGGSLLGSSRKSLADTSVTSTADLSVFSGGQRSQHTYDICVEDTRSVLSEIDDDREGEGESSPGSAFCSLSVVGQTASGLIIAPATRAVSPRDIVRIYVPPAPVAATTAGTTLSSPSSPPALSSHQQQSPPSQIHSSSSQQSQETIQYSNNNLSSSKISLTSVGVGVGGGGGDDGIVSGSGDNDRISIISSDIDINHFNSNNRNSILSNERLTPINKYPMPELEIHRSDEILSMTNEKVITSSLHRGNLTKKSPLSSSSTSLIIIESSTSPPIIIECNHIQTDKENTITTTTTTSSSTENLNKIKLNISLENISKPYEYNSISNYDVDDGGNNIDYNNKNNPSLEKLTNVNNTKKKYENIRQQIGSPPPPPLPPSIDTSVNPLSINELHNPNSKYISECNIQYKSFPSSTSTPTPARKDFEYKVLKEQPTNNSPYSNTFKKYEDDENDADDDDDEPENTKDIKLTGKMYSRLFSSIDDDDDDDETENYNKKKSSDESSSSPNSKSILNTPVNETLPLLSSSSLSPQTSTKITSEQVIPSKKQSKRNYEYDGDYEDDYEDEYVYNKDADNQNSCDVTPTSSRNFYVPEEKFDKSHITAVRPSRIPLYYSNNGGSSSSGGGGGGGGNSAGGSGNTFCNNSNKKSSVNKNNNLNNSDNSNSSNNITNSKNNSGSNLNNSRNKILATAPKSSELSSSSTATLDSHYNHHHHHHQHNYNQRSQMNNSNNFDNRMAVPIGGAYEFQNNNYNNNNNNNKSRSNNTKTKINDMNKIRIKITQNQRN